LESASGSVASGQRQGRTPESDEAAPSRQLAFGPNARGGALRAALAIAGTLAQAHSRGIVHGALKPECLRTGDSGEVRITGFQGAAASPAQFREAATADVAAFLHCAGVLLGPSGGPPPRLRGVFDGRVVLSADDPRQAMAALRDELRESLEDTFPWPIPGWERPPGKPAPVVQRVEQGGAPKRQTAPVPPTPPTALTPPKEARLAAAPVVAVPAVAAPAVAQPVTAAPAAPVAHPQSVIPATPVVAVVEPAGLHALQPSSQPASTPPARPGNGGAPMVQAAVARAVLQALESTAERPATPQVPAASRKAPRVAVQGAATAGSGRRQSAWWSGPAAWLCVGLLASAATLWVLDSVYGIADASSDAPTATPSAAVATLKSFPAAGTPVPQGAAETDSAVSAAITDGFARLEAGQPDLARAWFEHALTLQPDNARALAGQQQAAAAMGSSSLDRVSRLLEQAATTQR
jgi:hypothetical protein